MGRTINRKAWGSAIALLMVAAIAAAACWYLNRVIERAAGIPMREFADEINDDIVGRVMVERVPRECGNAFEITLLSEDGTSRTSVVIQEKDIVALDRSIKDLLPTGQTVKK